MSEINGRVVCDMRAGRIWVTWEGKQGQSDNRLCRCREDAGHDGAHVCPCGGSWLTDADGNFADVVEWPQMFPIPGLEAGADW